MSEALIFSILFMATCLYGALGTFLNWESSKKPLRKNEPFSLFDKILAVVLTFASILFFVFVLVKDI